MTDYKGIFTAIENSLYRNYSDEQSLRKELERFKHINHQEINDEQFYEITQVVVFASGIKASIMNKYHPGVRKYLPDIATAAALTPAQIQQITSSGEVIGLYDKVEACVNNARAIQQIVKSFGSTQAYINQFTPFEDIRNLLKLRDDIMNRFDRIKGVTSFHLMTDLGLPVLKPDRVIMRIFKRLGLVYDDSELINAVRIGQEFAAATGHAIRYIDIVLVSYGQMEIGNGNTGICLEKNPKCRLCDAQVFCLYKAKTST